MRKVTVVIRTHNEAHLLQECLQCIKECQYPVDVIVVDSESEDNTVEVAENFSAKVIQCVPFSYGRALNVGIAQAETELIAILSGHCFIRTPEYFHMLVPYFSYPATAAVYARQIPSPKSNVLDKRNLTLTYTDSPAINYSYSNAASMIRKSVWRKQPFDEEISACEDVKWANEIIRHFDHDIYYEPNAIVEHYHEESIADTIKRYEREYRALKSLGLVI